MTNTKQSAMQTEPGELRRLSTPAMDLKKPPIVETSLGCFFSPIPGWNVLHFGALFEIFRGKYPNVEFPLPVMEQPQLPVAVSWTPGDLLIPIRALFSDDKKTQLVQLQSTLFLHNWRKRDEHPTYEHYAQVLPMFKADWEVFVAFLGKNNLPRPKFSRYEMTYFNHIVRGEQWKGYEDLPKFFRNWRGFDSGSAFGNIEQAAFTVVQPIRKGKVTVVVAPGVRVSDGKEILQLNFTSTVLPGDQTDTDLFNGLDECHQIALVSFRNFVTDEALRAWGE